jgi:hypothetical protein
MTMSENKVIEKGDIREIIAKILRVVVESPVGQRNVFHFKEGNLTVYIDEYDHRFKVYISPIKRAN